MGRTNTMLPTEGLVFKGVDVGNMQSAYGLENGGVTICMIWMKLGKLVGGVGITA